MQIEPTADAFAARYDRGEAQVLWTTLVADLETPVSAFLKIAGSRPMSFLFESVEGGAVRGRYSIIGLDPDLIWRTNGPRAEINRNAERKPSDFAPCPQPPLEALRALIAESRIALPDDQAAMRSQVGSHDRGVGRAVVVGADQGLHDASRLHFVVVLPDDPFFAADVE